jgi:hypothetical protein
VSNGLGILVGETLVGCWLVMILGSDVYFASGMLELPERDGSDFVRLGMFVSELSYSMLCYLWQSYYG